LERALAASIRKDRQSASAREKLSALPQIKQVADEVLLFDALIDFTQKVEEVVKDWRTQSQTYESEANKKPLYDRLREAHGAFNGVLKGLHPRLRAGDRGESLIAPYLAYLGKERQLVNPANFAELDHAHQTLKHTVLEFILGGTAELEPGTQENPRKEIHHKLITRVSDAYKADRKHFRKEANAYERMRDTDREDPYNNPLNTHSLHTFNRVYEVRWVRAADKILDIVRRYQRSLEDPNIVPSSSQDGEKIWARSALDSTRTAVGDLAIKRVRELLDSKGGDKGRAR
jgi:hypothetical protein